ncbi:hypothetical protein K7711_36515 [Nocardia sp. CA2R105]|uniref:hypothetical protein n=1 Tax=Nocardia coffeae TaxID=2873381 RepID=UPI001CA73FAC|nr:hypothetical protein [Nocardia coffeae]MBY8862028.1 hypothetical protein [Nocardia coffeae]
MPETLPPQGRPDWQKRLLESIQNLAADRRLVLRTGPEPYPGTSDQQVRSWRTHLQVLSDASHEIETQASAIGIGRARIERARGRGHRGQRITRQPRDPREFAIDTVARDVWHLQHMTAIDVDRRERHSHKGIDEVSELADRAQFERNMAALWRHARTVSAEIGLTPGEYEGMWATDVQHWRTILVVAAYSYDDEVLDRRWRAYAEPSIAEGARSDESPLSDSPDRCGAIPIPHWTVMLSQAAHAATPPGNTAHPPQIESAIEVTLPPDGTYDWTTSDTAPAVPPPSTTAEHVGGTEP